MKEPDPTILGRVVRNIRVGNLPMRLVARGATLRVELNVVERDTRQRATIGMQQTFDWWQLVSEEAAERAVFDELRSIWEHELREQYTYDGVRIRDPHAEKP